MTGHHLILADAVQDGMHDGPLHRSLAPAAFGFGRGQTDDRAPSYVAMQRAAFDEDAAPDDFTGLADAFKRAAAQRKVHGRLAFAGGACIATDKGMRGRGAGDLQEPDEVSDI